jgi:hypothetical protein
VQLGPPVLILGEESAPGPTLFGEVRAGLLGEARRIHILDASDQSIRSFAYDGTFLHRAGRPGRGPGDLATPLALYSPLRGSFGVADQLNGLVEFDAKSGEPVHLRTYADRLRPRAACTLGGRTILAGFADGALVHVLSAAGILEHRFGGSFSKDSSDAVRATVDRMPVLLACATGPHVIVVAQHEGAGIRAYRPDGTLQWERVLPDYRGNFYFRDRRGYVTTGYGDDYTNSVQVLPSDGLVLVQVQRLRRLPAGSGRGRRVSVEVERTTSHLIDLGTGRLLRSQVDLPLFLSVRDGLALTLDTEPFPTVQLRAMTLR